MVLWHGGSPVKGYDSCSWLSSNYFHWGLLRGFIFQWWLNRWSCNLCCSQANINLFDSSSSAEQKFPESIFAFWKKKLEKLSWRTSDHHFSALSSTMDISLCSAKTLIHQMSKNVKMCEQENVMKASQQLMPKNWQCNINRASKFVMIKLSFSRRCTTSPLML